MFKDLKKAFERKEISLVKNQDKNRKITDEFGLFMKKEFGEVLKDIPFVVSYSAKDNTLTITTVNKVIANELVIRLELLTNFLKDKNINPNKILIR